MTILGTYEDDYACEEVEPMTQCCATVQCTGEGAINWKEELNKWRI